MKNIYIIPTDKASKLFFNKIENKFIIDNHFEDTIKESWFQDYNIYITSDEEIKEGDGFLDDNNSIGQSYKLSHVQFANPKKIILTTDQDLISDGIEQISENALLKIVEYINSGKNIESFDEL